MTRRILFLALSGVRVQDPELLALGLTLPGFVERSQVIASLPSLGLLTLAAFTPDDWELSYREWDQSDDHLAENIAAEGWSAVAISSLTARIDDAYTLCNRLKVLGITTILGGLHASAMPEEALSHADIVVQGEGELVWPTLLNDLSHNRHKRFYTSFEGGRPSHQKLPHRTPRYDLLDPSRYNRLTLQATRGCPIACSFCGASRTISPHRIHPLDRIRADLDAIRRIWPRPFIELADDNTFINPAWGLELCHLFQEQSVRWFTETDIRIARHPRLLDALAASGCRQVLIGFESSDPASLAGLDPGHLKSRWAGNIRDAVQAIQGCGISVNACFILGLDTQDASCFGKTLDFIDYLGAVEVQITLQTPFPGTALYQTLLQQGRLDHGKIWSRCTLFDITHQPARMSREELRMGFHRLMAETYHPDRVSQRRRLLKKMLADKQLDSSISE